MKKCILIAVALAAQSAQAQYSFRIQANASVLRTHLYNANDNSSGMVESGPKITPNGGLALGWINTQNRGFQGVQLGVDYLTYKQTTNGASTDPTDNGKPVGTSSSSLQYLSVPVEVRFGIGGLGQVVPFATIGGYASRLVSYTEESETVYTTPPPFGEVITRTYSFQAQEIRFRQIVRGQNSLPPVDSKIKEGIYQNWNFGLLASVGFEYSVGPRQLLSVRLPFRYGFGDVERKGALEYEPQQFKAPLTKDIYWDYNSPKAVSNVEINPNTPPNRGDTHAFSYGLELSYGFKFLSKKRY